MFVERFLTWVNSYILPAWKECMSILVIFNFRLGKRRYDRKQSGYGGQTKPIFHKKVNNWSDHIVYNNLSLH